MEKERMVKEIRKVKSNSKLGYSIEYQNFDIPLMALIEKGIENYVWSRCDGDQGWQYGVEYITTPEGDVLFSWDDYRYIPIRQEGESDNDFHARIDRDQKEYLRLADEKILEYADMIIESIRA